MKEIKDMTLEDIDMLEHICRLKSAGGKEIQQIKHIMQNYIDTKFHVCSTCHAQVRLAHQRVMYFYNTNRIEIENIRFHKTIEPDLSKYHLGGAYWQFGEVKIKGKQNAIDYYLENYG